MEFSLVVGDGISLNCILSARGKHSPILEFVKVPRSVTYFGSRGTDGMRAWITSEETISGFPIPTLQEFSICLL